MESLELDNTGDLVMENGSLQIINKLDEIIQCFYSLLRTNKNEWFLDPEAGFDYSIINDVKVIDEDDLAMGLQDIADQMDEIDRIEDINVEVDRRQREAFITCTAYTIDGLSFEAREVL